VLTLAPTVRIWFSTEPADMRMSFRGLSGLVRQRLRDDPRSGHLFCFVNRRRTMMKLLLCDRSGAWVFHRRLARGTFELPAVEAGAARVRLDPTDLALILEGIDLGSVTRRKRYRRPLEPVAET
jgi:transposase